MLWLHFRVDEYHCAAYFDVHKKVQGFDPPGVTVRSCGQQNQMSCRADRPTRIASAVTGRRTKVAAKPRRGGGQVCDFRLRGDRGGGGGWFPSTFKPASPFSRV